MRALLPDDAQFWTPVRRHRMPAGGGDRRPRTAGHARRDRSRRRHLRRPRRCRRTRCASSASTTRRSPTGPTIASSAPGEVGEITVAGPTATDSYFNRDAATRAGEDPRSACRTAANASCTAWATWAISMREGRLWFCGRKTQRVETARRPAVHRAGRAGVQHASRRAAAPRWSASARAARRRRCCAYELQPGVPARDRARIDDELRAHRRAPSRTPRACDASCCHPRLPGRHPPQRQDRPREAGGVGAAHTHATRTPRMKILVTGGGGFLGQALVPRAGRARARGHQLQPRPLPGARASSAWARCRATSPMRMR